MSVISRLVSPARRVAWLFAVCASVLTLAAQADPPARVARMAFVEGPVSFSPAGDDQWVGAIVNRPLITGDRVWADAGARAEIALDNGAFWIGSATSVTVANLDDRMTQLQLTQGEIDLRVRQLQPGGVVEIDTPNLALVVSRPGRYRVDVDPQATATLVSVRSGAADVYGEGTSYAIASGQTYRFAGNDLNNYELVDSRPPDAFDRWAQGREQRFDTAAARYVSPEVIGYEDLDTYGTWRADAAYGNVWFPSEVPTGWAPYRYGHWAWIDPWGWTWVDDAPWGFAPFHYGRWAYVGGAWGWVPGPVRVRPVYAPALVAFVGGSNFSIAVTSGPAIGWFPLGPGEVYRPAYNVSRDYFRQVNVSNTVINNTYITNVYENRNPGPVRYANMQVTNAVTAVPPAAFAQSRPVNRVAVPVSAPVLNRVEVRTGPDVAPSRVAFTGAAPAATSRPTTAVVDRPVVARTPPPPPPVPVAQRLPLLERNAGKPLDPAQIQAVRPASTTPPNVRIVETPRAPVSAGPAPQGSRTTTAAPTSVAPPASTMQRSEPPRAVAPASPTLAPPVTGVRPAEQTPSRVESRVVNPPPPTTTAVQPPRSAGPALVQDQKVPPEKTPRVESRIESRTTSPPPPTVTTVAPPRSAGPATYPNQGRPAETPQVNLAPQSPPRMPQELRRAETPQPAATPAGPPPQAQRIERIQAVPPAPPPAAAPAAVVRSAPPGPKPEGKSEAKHEEKKDKDKEK